MAENLRVKVKKAEALLEAETDKVNVEIEPPEDGFLKEIKAQILSVLTPWSQSSSKMAEIDSSLLC